MKASIPLQNNPTFTIADSLGAESGSAPSADTTYLGAMVGTPVPGQTNHGNVLVGDAEVAFAASTNSVGVAFTDIINIDKGGVAHSVSSISFAAENVAAGDGGVILPTDAMGVPINSGAIAARFYGPNHEEISGHFNHSNVMGAFGVWQPAALTELERFEAAIASAARAPNSAWLQGSSVSLSFSGWSCDFSGANLLDCDHANDVSLTADLRNIPLQSHFRTPLREQNGVNLVDVRVIGYQGVRRFGGWMEHSGFHLYTWVPAESADANTMLQASQKFTIADAFGTRSGSAPNATATYEGAMVGTPASGENHGDVLVGDAELGYNPNVDNMFTLRLANIYNVDEEKNHLDTSVVVASPYIGLASASADEGSLPVRVAFYGPNHEEVAGTFDLPQMIGAFGAKRQEQAQQEQPAESP